MAGSRFLLFLSAVYTASRKLTISRLLCRSATTLTLALIKKSTSQTAQCSRTRYEQAFLIFSGISIL